MKMASAACANSLERVTIGGPGLRKIWAIFPQCFNAASYLLHAQLDRNWIPNERMCNRPRVMVRLSRYVLVNSRHIGTKVVKRLSEGRQSENRIVRAKFVGRHSLQGVQQAFCNRVIVIDFKLDEIKTAFTKDAAHLLSKLLSRVAQCQYLVISAYASEPLSFPDGIKRSPRLSFPKKICKEYGSDRPYSLDPARPIRLGQPKFNSHVDQIRGDNRQQEQRFYISRLVNYSDNYHGSNISMRASTDKFRVRVQVAKLMWLLRNQDFEGA